MKTLYFSLHFLFVFLCMAGLSLASQPSSPCASTCSSSTDRALTPATPLERFRRSVLGQEISWQQWVVDYVVSDHKDFNCTQREDGSIRIDGKFQVGASTWAVYNNKGVCEDQSVKFKEPFDNWQSKIFITPRDGCFDIAFNMSGIAEERSGLRPGCLSGVSNLDRILVDLLKRLNPRSAIYGQ